MLGTSWPMISDVIARAFGPHTENALRYAGMKQFVIHAGVTESLEASASRGGAHRGTTARGSTT